VTPPSPRHLPLRRVDPTPWDRQAPTWREARATLIDGALKRAGARPTGNWYVLAASRRLPTARPLGRTVAGVEVVAWRGADGTPLAGPGACPHLGAPLCRGAVDEGALVCPWHGLALTHTGALGWEPFPTVDDGVLIWVRLDQAGGDRPTPRPAAARRPPLAASVAAVTETTGSCEPQDVIANRLDPWHGAWFHPYAFTRLRVLEEPDPADGDRFLVEVSYRLTSRLAVPVRATFTAPGPRTVVMEIVDGEGATSVVETHATPLTPADHPRPRTAVIEAVLATSPRRGFTAARAAAPLLRPLMRRAAARLWRDDLAYAERRWQLRSTGRFPGAS
jgi:nitrite reductase/ring-hydroxylating ferredoxin subunit